MKATNRFKRIILVTLFVMLTFGVTVNAATISKVTCKRTSFKSGSNYYQYSKISGYTSSGKKVWTYKTSLCYATELNSAKCITKGKYVFVIDDNRYLKLNKNNGKVLVKKSIPSSVWGAALCVDSSYNLYCIGYYSRILYKIKSNGKIAWKYEFPQKYYWPSKIQVTKSKVKVTFSGAYPAITVSIKNK